MVVYYTGPDVLTRNIRVPARECFHCHVYPISENMRWFIYGWLMFQMCLLMIIQPFGNASRELMSASNLSIEIPELCTNTSSFLLSLILSY